nr:MAG TPA: hypothetical protein [Caudoviricetes sp.]
MILFSCRRVTHTIAVQHIIGQSRWRIKNSGGCRWWQLRWSNSCGWQ